jgi:NAD+ synthase
MEQSHLRNARLLSAALSVPLAELDFQPFPRQLLTILQASDPQAGYDVGSALDIGKAKNSMRTWVHSMYAERGDLIVGTSNRTEVETGFYLPFGDGLSHIMPIAHLYKTQVRCLATRLGTRPEVLDQPPSAGYWPGESDLEDLAFWLFNGAPVLGELHLISTALAIVSKIRAELSFEAIDRGLYSISHGADAATVARISALDLETAERLVRLVGNVGSVKGRPLGVRLSPQEYSRVPQTGLRHA